MSSPEFLNPPIEVIATSPRLDMIKARLKSGGLRPYEAREDEINEDPLLIDAKSMTGTQLLQIRRLIARKMDRTIILLADPGAPLLADAIIITDDNELSSVPARLKVAARKRDRLREVRLRAQTAREIVGSRVKCYSDDPANMLYLGDGSSRFLAMTAAMKSFGVTVTAALTPLTAFDYLANQSFSCVLVDLDDGARRSLDFLQEYSGDFQLSNIPVFATIRSGERRSLEQQAALANATEIIDSDAPITNIAEQISMMAEYHKASTPMTPEMSDDNRLQDRITGLFTDTYLTRHLENQLIDADDYVLPLSFMTLQLSSPNDGNTTARKSLPTLSKFVLNEMRQTDCAGRLDWSTIGVSLRNTGYSGGVQLARRLLKKLGGDQLSTLGLSEGANCALSWRVIERRAYHSAEDLLIAGKKGPTTRIIRAA